MRKGEAYVRGYIDVWLFGKPTRRWEARDRWGTLIAFGSTRKECERYTRYEGYTPIRCYDDAY